MNGEQRIQITRRENRLFAQMSGSLPIEVFAESEDVFAYRVADAKILFHRDSSGGIPKLTFWQGAYAMPAERIPAEPWIPADPSAYCGIYHSDELDTTLAVRLGEKGLYIPFVKRGDLFLVPMAEERLAGKASSTKFRFVRGNDGKIRELRFSMLDAWNVRFRRKEKGPGGRRSEQLFSLDPYRQVHHSAARRRRLNLPACRFRAESGVVALLQRIFPSQVIEPRPSRYQPQCVSSSFLSWERPRWSRILTVSRVIPRISAISMFFIPSKTLSTTTARWFAGSLLMNLRTQPFISLRIREDSAEAGFSSTRPSGSRASASIPSTEGRFAAVFPRPGLKKDGLRSRSRAVLVAIR